MVVSVVSRRMKPPYVELWRALVARLFFIPILAPPPKCLCYRSVIAAGGELVMHLSEIFDAEHPLVLVGCGRMGQAMVHGWLKNGLSEKALIGINPSTPSKFPQGARHLTSAQDLPAEITPAAIVLAVKPGVIDSVLPALAHFGDRNILVISVAAGVRLNRLETVFESAVRAMPNTPSEIGHGITAAVAGRQVNERHHMLATALLGATGSMLWINDEDLMDAVTAVSGSGPAYIFAMTEAMAAAGRAEGLPDDVAMRLARQTVIGAAHLMAKRKDTDPGDLREQVTSPGGTTAAALAVLRAADGLGALVGRAIRAAARRSRELAG